MGRVNEPQKRSDKPEEKPNTQTKETGGDKEGGVRSTLGRKADSGVF